ncbi:hypothetical protein GLE_0680 [Lysobacter enzymogenes]|uniref:Uncharacterized protein n=1 Tax=Lysobacter enzymogenes TaxID=69 RepID=A0A0S2DBY1_LYSEN|nr:hypothetical protein GLE_0680 [Lysobacter enzymogenes]
MKKTAMTDRAKPQAMNCDASRRNLYAEKGEAPAGRAGASGCPPLLCH